jgi:hypothetical protein
MENDGYKYQLTVVDHFSSFPAFPLFSKKKEEVSSILVNLFYQYGPPKILHSDNGGEFVNSLIDCVAKTMNIQLAHGKAYNPREQGKVENFNGTLSVLLSKMMHERSTNRWIDLLDECLFAYRISKGILKRTPFEIFYMREPNFILELPEVVQREQQESRENQKILSMIQILKKLLKCIKKS